MIHVNGLTKFYGASKAIESVSFRISSGEIVGLLGLNGAGKSTILKILATYLRPTSGDVQIDDLSLTSNAEKIRGLIGYLPDKPPLYNEMTVTGYLRYVAEIRGVHRQSRVSWVEDVVKKTNLESVSTKYLGQLSHGFRQRVGIAQALVHKPHFIVLDEPINGLDPVQIREMRDLILSLRGHYTVILSSHILSEMTKTCDRILIVDKGRVVAEGSEEELTKKMGAKIVLELHCLANFEIRSVIAGIEGVVYLEERETEAGRFLLVHLDRDVRGEISKAVIDSGGELLEIKKSQSGLESLFIKLIKNED